MPLSTPGPGRPRRPGLLLLLLPLLPLLLRVLLLLLPESDERVGRSTERCCCGSLRVGRVSLLGRGVSRCGRDSWLGWSYERRLGVGSSRFCGRDCCG